MNIWHVGEVTWTKLMLFRSADGTFRVVQDGNFNRLLRNGNSILINSLFVPAFNGLSDQVTYEEVTIVDPASGSVWNNYVELNIKNEIDHVTIQSMDSSGLKIWRAAEYVFVSGDLKKELIKIRPQGWNFTEGFYGFGGDENE